MRADLDIELNLNAVAGYPYKESARQGGAIRFTARLSLGNASTAPWIERQADLK
jgi:hypothetical protein